MRKYFANKLANYKGILAWADANAAILAEYPALLTVTETFRSKTALIESKEGIFISATKGRSAFKQFLRKDMTERAFICAAALYLTAKESGNTGVQTFCKLNISDFNRARETELAIIVRKIADWAVTYATELTARKWVVTDTANLDDAVTQYNNVIGTKELAVEVRKTALSQMGELFKLTTGLLENDMDREVELIKKAHPTEYEQYQGAREINDMGIRHNPPPPPPVPPTNPG
ncbi:MAG: hypothetical protein WCJ01_10630 [Ignavibacteria bacterium]